MFFRREDESEGEDDEEYRFDENDAAEIANANEAAQLDADLEKLNSSEEVTDEDLSELYAEQCVDNKDISEDDQVLFTHSCSHSHQLSSVHMRLRSLALTCDRAL